MKYFGIGICILGIYRMCKLVYKSNNIKTAHWILGGLGTLLLLEAVDLLTTKWLYHLLGRITYYRCVGVAWDILIIGAYFCCDYIEPVSEKEKKMNKYRLVFVIVYLSWYFMYYLCK